MDSKDEKDGFMSVQEDEELPFEQTDLWSLSGRAHLYTSRKVCAFSEGNRSESYFRKGFADQKSDEETGF